jgi:long-chain acyl-CoA synthetase
VIGVSDPQTGQGVKLFVVKRDPALEANEITKFARENLAAYKVPKIIVFVDALPKSNVGKIIRKDLK